MAAVMRSEILPGDHRRLAIQRTNVAGQPSGGDQDRSESHDEPVPADSPPTESTIAAKSIERPARLADALLLIYADALDDFERTRIATENRVRALRQVKDMADTPEEQRLLAMCDVLRSLEHQAELELTRALRNHPLGPWVKATIGVGMKQGARLLAAIGDPYWNDAADRPRRGPAELWAYCGYHVLRPSQTRLDTQMFVAGVDSFGSDHVSRESQSRLVGADSSDTTDHTSPVAHAAGVGGVAPRRSRGVKANWNDTAKMRARLVAEAAVKAGVRQLDGVDDSNGYDVQNRKAISPLGAVYLDGRTKYADSIHSHPCAQCGPPRNPAPADSRLSLSHQHARALRIVAKNVLRDLFLEAKRLHELGEW